RPDVPDESADCVVSCFTLCTIPDVDAALRDVVRVLRPGGTFHFLEHGLAPDASVRAWQHRLEPVHCVLFGGCRLTRPIQGLVTASDLVLDEVHTEYAPVPTFLRPWTYGYRGRAHKPTRAA
ncbi:MAG: methyltransferase domain-containing protein, partial [Propionicimonas sp.]